MRLFYCKEIAYNFVMINSDLLFSWCSASEQVDSLVGSQAQLLSSCDSPKP